MAFLSRQAMIASMIADNEKLAEEGFLMKEDLPGCAEALNELSYREVKELYESWRGIVK